MAVKYGMYADNFASATTAKTAALVWPDGAAETVEFVELTMTGTGQAAVADTPHTARFVRCSAGSVGTAGAAQTPEPFEGTRASLSSCSIEYSNEPTTKATVYPVHFGFNSRGGLRWSVPKGEGVVCRGSDTNIKGIWEVIAQAAGAIDANVHFYEP